LNVQSKGGSINEMIFNWLGKGIDENLDVTTLRSTYLGCNACFVCFDLEPKSFKRSLSIMTFWVSNMIFIFEMWFDTKMFVDVFLKLNLSISCMMFYWWSKVAFLPLSLTTPTTKIEIQPNIWCQNSMWTCFYINFKVI
jgi:hypothetical protein